MTELALFISAFILVFSLGLQSLNVNGGHYVAAFMTSFMIGAGNLVVLKLAPNASITEMAAYMSGGPFGIIASMVFHRRFIEQETRLREFVEILAWRAKNQLGRVVCLFRGHHYDTPVLNPRCLYFCIRCNHELAGRTFDDLEPMTDEDLEQMHRELVGLDDCYLGGESK